MEDFAQFALPEEERKRLLLSNLMMGLGAGLLDSRGKNVWPAISTGLLGGMQMGQQAIGQAQRGMVDSYKLKREFEQDKEKKALAAAAAGKQAEYESALSGIFSGAPDLSRMGTGGPTPENAARVAPPDRIAQYRKAADFYMARNDVAKAKEAAAIADKLEEEYSTTPQTVRGADGKLQLVQFGKRGNAKVAEGMTPAEKLHFASTGSMAGVGLDPYSGAQVSAGLPMTMTPGEVASNEIARGNLGVAQANLGLSRERLNLDKTNAQRGEAWQNDLERGIQIDPRTGQSRPITSSGAPVGAKGASKQAEQSKTALTIINEAEKLVEKSTGSYLGAGVDQAARVFGGSTEGADASAQLQALEGALMLNQPRMEGPQSDKDTALYKQMAAKIGDPTVPNGQKKAALAVVKKLHQKYATGVSVGGATGGWSIQEVK